MEVLNLGNAARVIQDIPYVVGGFGALAWMR